MIASHRYAPLEQELTDPFDYSHLDGTSTPRPPYATKRPFQALQRWVYYSCFAVRTHRLRLMIALGVFLVYITGHFVSKSRPSKSSNDGGSKKRHAFTNVLDLRNAVNAYLHNTTKWPDIADISEWDVSRVQDFTEVFESHETFNEDIGDWDVSSVTSMELLFANALAFNRDISRWKTDRVTSMKGMFMGATQFQQEIGDWNTERVTTMFRMFAGALRFNNDIGAWNTSLVKDFGEMFEFCDRFNQDLSQWDVRGVLNRGFRDSSFERMFYGASAFDQNLCAWKDKLFAYDPEEQIPMAGMFEDTSCPNDASESFCHSCG